MTSQFPLPDAHPEVGKGFAPALLALDEHLFNPDSSQWLVIDSGNSAVPKTTVPSLLEGLELIGRGRVAALVGHLREGVGVVDVDVPGDLGTFLAAEVADWFRRRGCWVLERPSGGAHGRWHIFFAHPEYRYAPTASRAGLARAAEEFLKALAADVKVPRSELDLRDAVRPLSSRHRHGAMTRPKGDLRQALRSLRSVLPKQPAPSPLRPRAKVKGTRAAAVAPGGSELLVPLALHRWKRQLRDEWRLYLINGTVPAGSWSAGSTKSREAVAVDRSLVEAACTRELVWAIGNPETAWGVVRESHPRAMTKAKHQGRSWWVTYVWNQLVRSASELITTEPAAKPRVIEEPAGELVEAITQGRLELRRLMWNVPVRQRAALLQVGHQLLDRALRERSLRVACPERDLQLDCGLGDRKTIRAALARLNGHLGTLHTDCLSRTDRSSTSYEFELNVATGRGREIPPPVLDPPPVPRGLWQLLPRSSHSLWRALLGSPEGQMIEELSVDAGLVEKPDDRPSKSQKATTRAALVALNRAGMVRVDETGCWSAATRPRSAEVEHQASVAYARLSEVIRVERDSYRAGMASSWTAGRARAIKAAMRREKDWWESLPPAVRTERVALKTLEFAQMSLSQRESRKAQLAERRVAADVNELAHHRAWVEGMTADEYVGRSEGRKKSFRNLSPAERGASLASWHRHRLRYGLASLSLDVSVGGATRVKSWNDVDTALTEGAHRRDDAFLERQGVLVADYASRPAV